MAFLLTKTTRPGQVPLGNLSMEFPDVLDYDLELEGHGKFRLQLVWNRFVNLPERVVQTRSGTFSRVSNTGIVSTCTIPIHTRIQRVNMPLKLGKANGHL